MSSSLKASFFWSAVRNWGTRLGSVVVFLLLARILAPEQLGLFSATVAIIAVADLFADNGLGDAVIQVPEIDDQLLSAVLLINLFLGLLLAAGLYFCAPLLESYFTAPGLAPLLSIAVISLLLNAGSYVPQSVLRRRFEYKWLAIRALIATVISGGTGIVLALLGLGAMSMIVQVVLFALINFALVWSRPTFNPFVVPAFGRAVGILRFSASILLQRALYFVCTRVVELVVLHRFGAATLSMYIIGSRLYFVCTQLITAVLVDVSYSTFSRLAKDREELEQSFIAMLRGAVALTTPIFLGLAAIAPELCVTAFGDKGHAAAPYLFWVALFGNLQVAQFTCTNVLSAIGRPVIGTILFAIQAVISALILLPGWPLQPVELVALNAATLIVTWPLYLFACNRYSQMPWLAMVKAVVPSYAAGGLMIVAVNLLRVEVVHIIPSPLFRGILLSGVGATIFLGTMAILAPATLRQALQFRRRFGKKRISPDI